MYLKNMLTSMFLSIVNVDLGLIWDTKGVLTVGIHKILFVKKEPTTPLVNPVNLSSNSIMKKKISKNT